MLKEFQPHFDRFVGSGDENAIQRAKRTQVEYVGKEKEALRPYEAVLSPERERLIADTQEKIDALLASYGITVQSIPRDHIHVMSQEAIDDVTHSKGFSGHHHSMAQQILVEDNPLDIGFVKTLAHELLHAKAYHAGQFEISDDGDVLVDHVPYRTGVSMRVWKGTDYINYFGQINEAVTEELANQFFEEYVRRDPVFKKDVENMEIVKKFLLEASASGRMRQFANIFELLAAAHPEHIVAIIESDMDAIEKDRRVLEALDTLEKEGKVNWASYQEWRIYLSDYLEAVQEDSNGIYQTPHDVFKDFVKAQFTGDYLTLARKLKKIYGKGEFRRLANVSKIGGEDETNER